MQWPANPAPATLLVQPVGDLLPVRVELDHRAEGGAGLVDGRRPFEVHLGEAPHAQLAAVEAAAEIRDRGAGKFGVGYHVRNA